MNVRWSAVLFGYMVDYTLSTIIQLIAIALGFLEALQSPNLSKPVDLLLFALQLLATGAGGFVAGRLARSSQTMNGFLVGVVGILVITLLSIGQPPTPGIFVIGQVIGCALGALGGFLSGIGQGHT